MREGCLAGIAAYQNRCMNPIEVIVHCDEGIGRNCQTRCATDRISKRIRRAKIAISEGLADEMVPLLAVQATKLLDESFHQITPSPAAAGMPSSSFDVGTPSRGVRSRYSQRTIAGAATNTSTSACITWIISTGIWARNCMRLEPARSAPNNSAAGITPIGLDRPSS